jgi:hypothetical protein
MDEPDDGDLVTVKLNIVTSNFDKATLSALSLGETVSQTINRAIALYHEVMAAQPGQSVSWTFVDGTRGSVIRTR